MVCDLDAGACVDGAKILYGSPTGSDTATCTFPDPCSIVHAFDVADTLHQTIKLASGTYDLCAVTIAGKTIDLDGFGATLRSGTSTGCALVISTDGANVRVRGVTVHTPDAFRCVRNTNASTPTLELRDISIDSTQALAATDCMVGIVRSHFRFLPAVNFNGIFVSSSTLTIDRSLFDGTSDLAAIALGNGSQLKMTNSVLADQTGPQGALRFGATGGGTVSFSTFYRSHINCGTGPQVLGCAGAICFDNTIFVDGANAASSDSVSGSQYCHHDHDLSFPQTGTFDGTGNLINVDPKLVSPTTGDFHLQSGSPAIDAADPTATLDHDFDGTPRPQGARSDIGAFELHP